jgi:hypothetical protein
MSRRAAEESSEQRSARQMTHRGGISTEKQHYDIFSWYCIEKSSFIVRNREK